MHFSTPSTHLPDIACLLECHFYFHIHCILIVFVNSLKKAIALRGKSLPQESKILKLQLYCFPFIDIANLSVFFVSLEIGTNQ